MKFTLKTLFLTTLLTFGCLLASSIDTFAGIVQTWEESYNANSGGTLYIESDIGSIYIETNTANKVEIEIAAKLDTRSERKTEEILENLKLEFEQDGDDVSIFAEFKNRNIWSLWGSRGSSLGLEFHISVPEEYNLDLFTAGGSIDVNNLTGEARVETSGGSLRFREIKGLIEGKTSGGSIRLESCVGDVDVKTSGGSITARIEGQPEDDCRLSTSGGGVTVYLSRNINVDIDASTSAGHVETDFPVTIRGKVRKSSLKGQINEGGPELYLRTSAGNINILEI
ncbi:MAG: hypothetical protein CVT49_01740 [candidate division Zixibacteria bacterium HGW-Zixibacteria-1]|nr:MAG: hypothetical protein CVT49_01740 [candidate division Zixibacteria bacterium HGW-Zixibacteria-1]